MSIEIKNLSYTYDKGGHFATTAINDINFTINDGEFFGIIGHTGSGKSTLIQHLNGLIRPTSGTVIVDGINIATTKNLKELRQKVALVFQYPEYQLFEETIEKDVAFAPKNMGLSEIEIKERVQNALTTVGIDYQQYKDRSPFDLSGGQKRRVAIAGVIASDPKVLILDEPTAGLDPRGRKEILQLLVDLNKKGVTIVMVSHSMDEVARHADRIAVLANHKLEIIGTPQEIFRNRHALKEIGLDVPETTLIIEKLNEKGFDIPMDLYTSSQLGEYLVRLLSKQER